MNSKNIFLAGIFIVLLWVAYYFTIKMPKDKINQDDWRRTSLNQCYIEAHTTYVNSWNGLCNKLGYDDNCLLSNTQADNLQQARVSDRINCEKLFGI